ncbi:DUF3025 domain-containing protein [Psychrosphaera aestuarii]|uniref:DUF3025 domain-containing protein n=1 Tax=Psychrosphaera aestuarii TaxID=1266052 RepID=UPI001B334011|nr:DUF3025 domain-containing protein [Psychrosphaera aestuarii]
MKKFSSFTHWTTEFADQGCFTDINHVAAFDDWFQWPSCAALDSLLPYEVENNNGKVIRFVEQAASKDYNAVEYETFIYETGQVPTRKECWHDIFGALVWSLFPKTKALINELHYKDIQSSDSQERSKLRNALTLFDECGVVLVTKNQAVLTALKSHDWNTAFIELREMWHKANDEGVAVYQFGHANYEMLTKPFIGLTGKWLVIDSSAEIRGLPKNVQYRLLDERLATRIKEGVLKDNTQMSPLPLLGVPGWHDENEVLTFYDNTEYFRPKPENKA